MKRIFISGATGNIGFELIKFLYKNNTSNKIIAGLRDIEKSKNLFKAFPALEFRQFDFEDAATFEGAFAGIDRVFLMRPPHISDVEQYFKPLIQQLKRQNVNDVMFLSVQGAEKSKVIPHNKIERLLKEFDFNYIFLRPAYFMQNLTTTLLSDITKKRAIILPAGNAKFNWVDTENISELAAIMLDSFEVYKNQHFEITGPENRSFQEAVNLINANINNPIYYRNVNPWRFFMLKRKEGMAKGMILVMLLLHFLPRFQKEPPLSACYEQITGKQATDLKAFILREKDKLQS